MSDLTKIQWTDATWNPTRGCSLVNAGCENCYAMRQAHRFSGPGKAYEGLTKLTSRGPVWTGGVRVIPELLDWPLRKRKPLRIFVDSMSDLFHEAVPFEFIDRVFATMALAGRHCFQVLSKRPGRMREYLCAERIMEIINAAARQHDEKLPRPHWFTSAVDEVGEDWPLPNVHLGYSASTQKDLEAGISDLLATPAAVRFLSLEPLLEPIELSQSWRDYLSGWDTEAEHGKHDDRGNCVDCPVPVQVQTEKIDWVIIGGESGPKARPCNVEWIRSIVKQCHEAGVSVFCKQLGSNSTGHPIPGKRTSLDGLVRNWRRCLADGKGGDPSEWPADLRIREFPR